MHIAICDDNIADRHQSERLLSRESDRRKTEDEAYYIDSYGSREAIMPSASMYDIFFIDMTSDPENDGLNLVCELQKSGAAGWFVLCSSSIDYEAEIEKRRESIPYPRHLRTLRKPILVEELRTMIDEIGPLAMKKVPLIELRSLALGETVYVQPHDIICATSDSYNTRVRLSLEGRSEIVVPGQAYVTFMSVTGNPYFVPTHDANGFVNTAHVKKVSPFRIEMDDGTAVRTTPHYAGLVRKQMQWLSE